MSRERRRAALAALCVLAVALAATLLPASGFGSQPAGVGVGDGPDASVGDGTGPDDTASTSEPDRTTPPAPTTTDSGSSDSSPTATTTTTRADKTTTTTETASSETGGNLRNLLGGIVLAALGLVGLVCFVGFWTGALAVSTGAAGPVPFTIVVGGTPVGELVGGIPNRTMALVVGLSASVPRLLDDATTLTTEAGRGFGSLVGRVARGTSEALRIGVRGLAATVGAIPKALAGLGTGAGILSSIGSVGMPSFGRGGDDADERGATPNARTEPDETGPPSIEEAWQSMRDRVPVRNRDARTPGEVARAAARRGFPDDEVRRLTDAFREVRYGDLPRDERTSSARSALDRLREYWRDEK